jgi:hypothetical protein
MRKDMKHVIIDRPRTGGDGGKSVPVKGYKKQHAKELDSGEERKREPIDRPYGYNTKNLNEHLSPLVRWLEKQCGRPWSKVWSEICDGLSVRNATTAHVRDHADQYVEKNCQIIDGKVYDSEGHRIGDYGFWGRFYVCPKSGLLKKAKRWKYRATPKKPDHVPGEGNLRYYLLKGAWFEVEMAPMPNTDGRHLVHDVLTGDYTRVVATGKIYRYGDHEKFYAARKRPLNKREIKKLGLWDTEIGREARAG